MTDGGERGHVEHTAHRGPAAVDVALAAELAAVVVERSNADERGGLRIAEAAEFRHQGEHGERGDAAHAINLLQALGAGFDLRTGGQMLVDQRVELRELLLQLLLPLAGELHHHGQAGVFAAVDLVGDEGDEILARAHQLGELGLAFGGNSAGGCSFTP